MVALTMLRYFAVFRVLTLSCSGLVSVVTEWKTAARKPLTSRGDYLEKQFEEYTILFILLFLVFPGAELRIPI